MTVFVLCVLTVFAQDQPVSFEMAFRDGGPSLVLDNGAFDGWIDARHLVWIDRDQSDQEVVFSLDIKSGDRSLHRASTASSHAYGEPARTSDRRFEVVVQDGDLVLRNLADSTTRRLTASAAVEQNPWFSPDDQKVAYTRDGNLYVMELGSGLERQLTTDGSDTIYNGWASWVYFEEILGRASRYKAFWWSPDSSKIAFMRFDDTDVKQFQIYHSEGQYGHWESTRYPKAGATNPEVKFGVVTVATGALQWMDFDPSQDDYLAWPFWAPDSKTLHVQWMNRDQDHLKIYACNAASGETSSIYDEQQSSWVEFFDDITYLDDGQGFILRSDKDGYRHLYLHQMNGSLKARLTEGEWDVTEILGVDMHTRRVYFMANKSDSVNRDLMVAGLGGGDVRMISKPGGTHDIALSPDFKHYVDSYSAFDDPGHVAVHAIDGQLVRMLAERANPAADAYAQGRVEFFRIPTGDGYQLPAWWVVPNDMDTSGATKYAVIFDIYSGPNTPTVRNLYAARGRLARPWSDHYFANHGVITISVDHRASGHFGKRGVSLMHRNLGHWEVHDLVAAAKWLKQKPYIDPQRIGIRGHSYGGYMTLLALTRAPEHFTHGVAGSPVTDWALYDTVYTERYMDRPQDNPDGYRKGSILTDVDPLVGKLRLIHGDIDDNVHFQNSLQLVAALTERGKLFEFMVYPGSRHHIAQQRHHQDSENAFWFHHFLGEDFPPAP